MELMQALRTRRSIRKFADRPVSDEMIREILKAAMMAPSAGNGQPWQFVVLTDREKLKAAAEVHPYVKMAATAAAGVLICGDLSLEKYPGYWVQDCSAAMENMLLAIHGLGLGAVWTGVYPKEDRMKGFSELVGLPETVIPLGFVPLGWPDQTAGEIDRFREDRIHFNTY
jgi:nitroreductase